MVEARDELHRMLNEVIESLCNFVCFCSLFIYFDTF